MCTSLSFLCSSDGPNLPFGSWLLTIADSVRLICVISGLVIAAATPTLSRRSWTALQRLRMVSIGLFALVAGTTELEHLGDYPSYRLLFNIVAVGFALRGYGLTPRSLLHRREG